MLTPWWLKVKRAQKHMVDIHREAWRYASRHPYSFSRIRLPDSKRNVLYRMRITEQPNPMIAIMLGDFIHNLRCALDYIIVASVPRRRQNSASFPILLEDIFATDDDGNYVVNDAERRKNFETAINGLSPEAGKCVVGTQPYHLGGEAYRHNLGIISRLENADKHRQLITVGGGVQGITAMFSLRGIAATAPFTEFGFTDEFAKDGTIVGIELPTDFPMPDGTAIQPSEVGMELTGTAKIFIKITRVTPNEPTSDFPLRLTMLNASGDVRRMLRLLEPIAHN